MNSKKKVARKIDQVVSVSVQQKCSSFWYKDQTFAASPTLFS